MIVNRNIFEFRGPRCTTDPSKLFANTYKICKKNGNDLHDLDFDLVTLRSSGYVDLVYTYLWYEYDDYQRTLRKRAKPAKNGNDLGDLDVNPVTLRSSGYVDLVYTYL